MTQTEGRRPPPPEELALSVIDQMILRQQAVGSFNDSTRASTSDLQRSFSKLDKLKLSSICPLMNSYTDNLGTISLLLRALAWHRDAGVLVISENVLRTALPLWMTGWW